MNIPPNDLLIFLGLVFFYSYSDLKSRSISTHWIFLPIIGFALYKGRVLETTVFLAAATIIGTYDVRLKRFLKNHDKRAFDNYRTHTLYRGGDARLMTLAVAASQLGIIAVVFSWVFAIGFGKAFKTGSLPYAPFLLAGIAVTFFLAYLCPVKIL